MKKIRNKQKPAENRRSRRDFARMLVLAGTGIPLAGSIVSAGAMIPSLSGTGSRSGPGTGFKINLFSKHLQFLDYEEMAEACAMAGLDGVDLTVRPGGHVLPENVEKDLPRAAKAIRDAELELIMMTTGITDPDDPLTETILGVASELGIRYYRTGYLIYDHALEMEENLSLFRVKMKRLAVLNEKYRIHGAYQNHAGTKFGAPVWDLWEVIRDLDPRWTGCQYDIRHAVVEGARSWPLGLELLKDHILCLVIKDFEWSEEEGEWNIRNVPIGEGMVDFQGYFKKLQELNISGPISLHIEYPLFPDRKMPPGQKKTMAIRTIRQEVESLKELIPSSSV
ncbi:MAG: sugar phosphate isomerase/epimerase family protein [Bacteroidales bacterium]